MSAAGPAGEDRSEDAAMMNKDAARSALVGAGIDAVPSVRFHWLSVLYWVTPLLLFAVQLRFSMASMTQLRSEETAESIRNVYWLDLHKLHDGVSSNLGYYGLLLLAYKLFGFSVHAAKYARAALHLVSLLCLAEVLRRVMGKARAVVPLVTIGLSPTLIYFNAIQTSFGIDLQYFPICLLILMVNRFRAGFASCVLSALLGITCMIACMSFPTFVLYMPVLAVAGLIKIYRQRSENASHPWNLTAHDVCMLLGFAAPLGFALLWVDRPGDLLYDPTYRTGIFRGGGGGPLVLNAKAILASVKVIWWDLLVEGQSFHFELARAEFAGLTGGVALVFVLAASLVAFHRIQELRPVLALGWGMIAINLILPCLGSGAPGLRRCTGMLAGFYVLYAVTWQRLAMMRFSHPWPAWIGIALCLLLPLHSLGALPANCESAARRSQFSTDPWFSIRGNAEQSVDFLLKRTQEGRPLLCRNEKGKVVFCPYGEIYATLAGWRRWNKKPEIPIYGLDPRNPRKGSLIQLNPRLGGT
jgi:hypothetical protein